MTDGTVSQRSSQGGGIHIKENTGARIRDMKRPRPFKPLSRALRSVRRWLFVVLALGGLLAAPVAAVSHELQHLRGAGSETTQKHGGVSPACQLCAAYANLGNGLISLAPCAISSAAQCVHALHTETGAPTRQLAAYRERAPPLSL